MGNKKREKYLNSKKAKTDYIDNYSFYLFNELSGGLTLEEVCTEKGARYSEFITEINSSPRLVQAVSDGKMAGHAYWQKKLKTLMLDKDNQPTLIKLWYANYMDWYDRPIDVKQDSNTTVIINVLLHQPKKKQQKLINKHFPTGENNA